jgi:hypothetical protein
MKKTILMGRHEESLDTTTELISSHQFGEIIEEFKTTKEKTIILDFGYCRGGDPSRAFDLIELILMSKKRVIAKATGDLLASAAAYVFIACQVRLIPKTKEFIVKIHPVQLSLSSAHLDEEGRIPRKAYRRTLVLNKKIATLLCLRTRLTLEQVNRIITGKGDTSFTWSQTIEAGLADGVVT